MPCLSKVSASHLLRPISAMPTVRRASRTARQHSVALLQQVDRAPARRRRHRCGCRAGASQAPSAAGRLRADRRRACLSLIEDGIEVFKQRQRAARRRLRRKARRSAPAIARCAPAAWRCFGKPSAAAACFSSAIVLAGKAAPGAERVEAVSVAVFVNDGGERADLLEALGRRHLDAGFGAQPAPIIKTVLRDDAHAGGDEIAQPVERPARDRSSRLSGCRSGK